MKGVARRLVLKERFHGRGLSTSSSSLLAFEQNPLLTSKVNNKFIDEQKKSDNSLLAKIEAIVFLGGWVGVGLDFPKVRRDIILIDRTTK